MFTKTIYNKKAVIHIKTVLRYQDGYKTSESRSMTFILTVAVLWIIQILKE